MNKTLNIRQDTELKRIVALPEDKKPSFNWGNDINESLKIVNVSFGKKKEPLRPSTISNIVGNALTDLLLSREIEEEIIFSQNNQNFVHNITKDVVNYLNTSDGLQLSKNNLDLLIEKSLIEAEAHDVAQSLVFNRDPGVTTHESPISLSLIRRNGQVVPWNQNKIEIAVRKAFLQIEINSDPAIDIAEGVTEKLIEKGQAFVNIEDVQDTVQEELMRQGHFKVAASYILYRSHQAQLREEETKSPKTQETQETLVMVTEEDGTSNFWDGSELEKRIEFSLIGLDLCLSKFEIEKELRRAVYSEMNREDLNRTIILNAKSLMEKDADFALFAGRLLLTYIYEEVLDWNILTDGIGTIKSAHKRGFKKYLKNAIKIERIDPKLLEYNIEELAEALDPSADLNFDYLGIQTLYDRYLIVDKTEKKHTRLEVPQFFWMRVAIGLCKEEKSNKENHAINLYNLYKSRRFCSSTPTLFNSGTLHSQLSSCYLYKVDDTIESIMYRGISENAFLSKWAGGLGGSWTSVRGTGGFIKGTNGESQGLIPFLKLHNDQLVAVNQGGKRRGSGCAYLETWHNDILDFLELRKNTGDDRRRCHDMNTANWIPDLFMKRMEARENWTLFRSNETPDLHDLYGKEFEKKYVEYEEKASAGEIFGKTIPAIELWKSMLKMIFETGHPWITFKDPCNIRSPQDHVGVIHSSNLCTEITLNTNEEETAVCNLGSVVLDSHLDSEGNIDHKKLKETIQIAVRALDNVIDINFYPTKAAKTSNSRHRPIGLGVMGLQNALYAKNIAFGSQEAIEFNDEFMEAIAYYAYEASSDIAAEQGTYSSYKGSKWDRGIFPQDTIELLQNERGVEIDIPRGGKLDWTPLREKVAKQGMRNSNVLAIAPTATISNIMGTTPCIEPNYKNLFVKSNLSGDFIILNRSLVQDLKNENLWTEEIREQIKYFDGELENIENIPFKIRNRYKTAFAIEYKYFIEAAARRQKWIDQSQSVNLFLAVADIKTLSHMYRDAWRKGLKTTYYLRTLGASNIEKATSNVKKEVRGLAGKNTENKEIKACSLEAMMNGEICESCQ